uniref:Uncharacterized protein n=1 Tax=Anopheles albimanus TaxID=7167 RepID=A0A182FBI3_ANOAL
MNRATRQTTAEYQRLATTDLVSDSSDSEPEDTVVAVEGGASEESDAAVPGGGRWRDGTIVDIDPLQRGRKIEMYPQGGATGNKSLFTSPREKFRCRGIVRLRVSHAVEVVPLGVAWFRSRLAREGV